MREPLAGVLGMYAALLARFEPRHGEAAAFLDEAIAILTKHGLKQAFGGRTLDQLHELRAGLAA